jgi:hypothetical protein
MQMDHISYRDVAGLYEVIPVDSAIQVWNNSAHEGTLKELKQKIIHGTSVLARIESEACVEQRLCTLYFTQKISRKELKEQIADVFDDEELLDAFCDALHKMKMDKIYCKMVRTSFEMHNLLLFRLSDDFLSILPFAEFNCADLHP